MKWQIWCMFILKNNVKTPFCHFVPCCVLHAVQWLCFSTVTQNILKYLPLMFKLSLLNSWISLLHIVIGWEFLKMKSIMVDDCDKTNPSLPVKNFSSKSFFGNLPTCFFPYKIWKWLQKLNFRQEGPIFWERCHLWEGAFEPIYIILSPATSASAQKHWVRKD